MLIVEIDFNISQKYQVKSKTHKLYKTLYFFLSVSVNPNFSCILIYIVLVLILYNFW